MPLGYTELLSGHTVRERRGAQMRERGRQKEREAFCSFQPLTVKGSDLKVSSTIYRGGEAISSTLRRGREPVCEIKTKRRDYRTNLCIHLAPGNLPGKPYPCAIGNCYFWIWCIPVNFNFMIWKVTENPTVILALKQLMLFIMTWPYSML